MSGDKYIVEFTRSYSRPGGPGYNMGERATFDKDEAERIVSFGWGKLLRTLPSTQEAPNKAPDDPPKNKMVADPVAKKTSGGKGGR